MRPFILQYTLLRWSHLDYTVNKLCFGAALFATKGTKVQNPGQSETVINLLGTLGPRTLAEALHLIFVLF